MVQQDILIPIGITLVVDGLSNDIHSQLLSSRIRETYLIHTGIKVRVSMAEPTGSQSRF